MTLGPIWGHPFHVLINELERHVAVIWKIRVKTFPKNISRYIQIIEFQKVLLKLSIETNHQILSFMRSIPLMLGL